MISRTNVVLAGLLVVVLLMTSMARVDLSRPNFEVLPDMKYTPAWNAFAENSNFANGRTMQAPVPGTIARGAIPLHYAATKEDALRAGEELRNPFALGPSEVVVTPDEARVVLEQPPANPPAADGISPPGPETAESPTQASLESRRAASVARGSETYRVFCVTCHGPQGLGDGPVTKRGFPPPPSLKTGNSPKMKDGQLFHILTYGQGNMASFAAQLAHSQRWDVINYVRNLQRTASTDDPEPAAPPPANEATPNGASPNGASTNGAAASGTSTKEVP